MPRKKSIAAPIAVAAAADQTLEAQLESVTWPEEDESVAARLTRVGALVLSCDAAGVQVPKSVRQSVPTPAQIVAEYHRVHAIESEATKTLKALKTYILTYLDRPGCDGSDEYLGADGYGLKRTPGCSAEVLSTTRLVELGVDPAAIDRATSSGTPYFQIRLIKPKEGE